MVRLLVALVRSKDAQGVFEYALIVAVVAIACFATMVLMGQAVNNTYGLQNEVSGF
jgi:Flp pilus assembly pilin Flp